MSTDNKSATKVGGLKPGEKHFTKPVPGAKPAPAAKIEKPAKPAPANGGN